MIERKHILVFAQLLVSLLSMAQGSSHTSSITIPMDGIVRNYSTSSSIADNVVCASTGDSPITWFSFTTNGAAHCPLITITASDNLPCEVAMYSSISGNMSNNLELESSMCFDDGLGLWAPAETFIVGGNKTYYLRIKTKTDCTLSIGGQHHLPPNDDCTGALSIGTNPIADNNACHTPGPGVSPDQLCAFTLENTAFYKFYVASTGNSIINITDISCDNGSINNSSGFQIGFLTGNCISLMPLNCTSGSGNFVQATSPPLAAGTKVYVAIDGNGGSNCSYKIAGINVVGVLESGVRNFSVWELAYSNRLQWELAAVSYGLTIFIERSDDGRNFHTISTILPQVTENTQRFSFDDNNPSSHDYYRLKIVSANGEREYSAIREIRRRQNNSFHIKFQNPVNSVLNAIINKNSAGFIQMKISSASGQSLYQASIYCSQGNTPFSKDLSSLPSGKYFIELKTGNEIFTQHFILLK